MGVLFRHVFVGAAILVPLSIQLLAPGHAAAITNTGSVLTTTPIAVNLTAKPGQTITTTLQVQNNSPLPKTIDVTLRLFKAAGDTGQAALFKPGGKDVSASWVHFSQNSFVAEPGVWNHVTMTINLPEDAALGYYYAVLFQPRAVAELPSDTNKFKSANAVFVLVDAQTSGEHRSLFLNRFASAKHVYEYLPANFTVTINNTGNIHVVPRGNVFISRSKTGKTLATLAFNPGQGNILPQSTRQFQAEWDDGFPAFQPKRVNSLLVSDKAGKPIQELHWDSNSSLSKIRFGRYYAHVALAYSSGIANVTSETDSYITFWVIPWKLILLVIGTLATLIASWIFAMRAVRKIWRFLQKPAKPI
jgi:hypothetical protein